MRKRNKFISTISILALAAGCSKKTVDTFETGSTDVPVVDTPPANNYLWLHHKAETGALRFTHQSGDWSKQCKVDLDSTNPAERDISCVVESTELDLMHIGMNIEYNVPAHIKCPYAATMAPYFFQYEPPRNDSADNPIPAKPHIEPIYVEYNQDTDAGTTSVAGYYDSGKVKANPYIEMIEGGYTCSYNYAPYGPNCCEGEYTELAIVKSGGITTKTLSTKNWGGKHSNCLNGPAMSLNPLNAEGWPAVLVWRMKEQVGSQFKNDNDNTFQSPLEILDGIKIKLADSTPTKNFGSFDVPSLITKGLGTTRYLATYKNGAVPRAFSDILNYYDSAYPPGYLWRANYADPRYYTMLCADHAFEITARIKLQIREWNTYSELKTAVENLTEPSSSEDNKSGNETDFPSFPNHDFYDWEDTSGWSSIFDGNGNVTSGTGQFPGAVL
ncbi:MAG: hypothetical protein RJB66_621 [Pseudomonadota bacterium]|jgi:hypothetical protein